MKSPIELLPIEIINFIINIVAHQDVECQDEDYPDLKACSLTCHAFLPHCRSHLFHVMNILDRILLQQCIQLLTNSPWIGHHVRVLLLSSMNSNTLSQTSLEAFDHLTHLNHLKIFLYGPPDRSVWTYIRPSTRSPLVRLMRLPTLTRLELTGIEDMPLSDIAPAFKNLNRLEISNVLFKEDREPEAEAICCTTILDLQGQNTIKNMADILHKGMTRGKLILDFRRVRMLKLTMNESGTRPQFNQIIKEAQKLEVFELSFAGGLGSKAKFASLLAFPSQSLKNLKIHISYFARVTMPVFVEELRIISETAGHCIQYLSLIFVMKDTAGVQSKMQEIPWHLMVDVVMTSRNWTSLQQFRLGIYAPFSLHHINFINHQSYPEDWENTLKLRLLPGLTSPQRGFQFFYRFSARADCEHLYKDDDDRVKWEELLKC